MDPAATGRRYLTLPPDPPLRPFVECLWVNAIPRSAESDDRRILPDGRMDLVWIPGLGVVVAGPQSRHTRRPVEAPLLAVGARFHPGVAPKLLRVPASELVDEPDPVVRAATRLLGGRGATVAGVATRVSISERQLERRFAERVGYGPKTFQRISRFQRMVGELRRNGGGLARVAASAGYADQAHLTRESRRLAGLTPRRLVEWQTADGPGSRATS